MKFALGIRSILVVALVLTAASGFADTHTAGAPSLSSDPGAPYTLYMDFAGFNFTGTWGGHAGDKTPGSVQAFEGAGASFSSDQVAEIKDMWSAVANAFTPFNINVTTIDPSVAAGQADTDAHRQAYYDQQARLMHNVVTPTNFYGPTAAGVSYTSSAPNSYATAGWNSDAGRGMHTDWTFITAGNYDTLFDPATTSHEVGHMLTLMHQSDYNASYSNEYSAGDPSTLPGTYSPIMGAGYTQRDTWRLGNTNHSATFQNDAGLIVSLDGMGGFREDGVGHTRAAASTLPLTGGSVNSALARGIIVPASVANPFPMGVDNYTKDYWKFASDGVTSIFLDVYDGNDLLAPGAQDAMPTLRSRLNILDADGNLVVSGAEYSTTTDEYIYQVLPKGIYTAEITSYGGHAQTLDDGNGGVFQTTYYYDMGGYFITGSGFAAVPEPATALLAGTGVFGALLRLRRRRV